MIDRHLLRGTVGLAAVVALGVGQAHAELRGKVYLLINPDAPRSEWRRLPLPRAFVSVSWTVTIPAPAHAYSSCRYSELARTDEHGDYAMAGPNFVTAGMASTSYYAYSPGLEPIAFPYGGSPIAPQDITMARSKRAAAERLSQIALFSEPGCFEAQLTDPHRLLVPYLRDVLDEAKTLDVDTPRGRSDLEHIEAVLRRASGLDRPGPLRVVPLPASRSIQSVPLVPPTTPQE